MQKNNDYFANKFNGRKHWYSQKWNVRNMVKIGKAIINLKEWCFVKYMLSTCSGWHERLLWFWRSVRSLLAKNLIWSRCHMYMVFVLVISNRMCYLPGWVSSVKRWKSFFKSFLNHSESLPSDKPDIWTLVLYEVYWKHHQFMSITPIKVYPLLICVFAL